MSARTTAEAAYWVAVRATDPRAKTAEAVRALSLGPSVSVVALGKAAVGMAEGALAALSDASRLVLGGVVVSNASPTAMVGPLPVFVGDHPVPSVHSAAAADALEHAVARARSATDALVLISGGTTSLVAAPVPGVTAPQLHATFEALLASGAPIDVMNAVRRRLLRWGAGRLRRALGPARVHCLIVSDVMGNAPEAIGSGPCIDEPLAPDAVARMVHEWGLAEQLPSAVRAVLGEADHERAAPMPNGAPLTTLRIIADNADAVQAARVALRAQGYAIDLPPVALAGEAAPLGAAIADYVQESAKRRDAPPRRAFVLGGEPTVTLPPSDRGAGGRCQELALAAARSFARHEPMPPIVLLAAGTDGRDGPTDAAGAVVDARTWGAIRTAGIDPDVALARHDAHGALNAVGATFVTGPTGTNVNDLVIGLLTFD